MGAFERGNEQGPAVPAQASDPSLLGSREEGDILDFNPMDPGERQKVGDYLQFPPLRFA
jgi:hypothetical protein